MMSASAAWAIWLIALGMTLLAAIGFAAPISATASPGQQARGRGKRAHRRYRRLRSERAAITETRAISTIEAEIHARSRSPPRSGSRPRAQHVTMRHPARLVRMCSSYGRRLVWRSGATPRRRAAQRGDAARTVAGNHPGDPAATMGGRSCGLDQPRHVSLTPHDIHRNAHHRAHHHPGAPGIIFMFATELMRLRREMRGDASARVGAERQKTSRSWPITARPL